jgi:hypothetical protein
MNATVSRVLLLNVVKEGELMIPGERIFRIS